MTRRTPARMRTRILTQGVTPSLHVYYKNTRIKQYHKEQRALRTETTDQQHLRLRHRQTTAQFAEAARNRLPRQPPAARSRAPQLRLHTRRADLSAGQRPGRACRPARLRTALCRSTLFLVAACHHHVPPAPRRLPGGPTCASISRLSMAATQRDLPSDLHGIISIPFDEPADLSDRSACADKIAKVAAHLKDIVQREGPSPYHARVPLHRR